MFVHTTLRDGEELRDNITENDRWEREEQDQYLWHRILGY